MLDCNVPIADTIKASRMELLVEAELQFTDD